MGKQLRVLLLVSIAFAGLHSCYRVPVDHSDITSRIAMYDGMDSSLSTTIKVVPQSVNLGTIDYQEQYEGRFWLKNTGSKDFHVDTMSGFCECVETSYLDSIIHAGDSIPIEYRIHLERGDDTIHRVIVTVGNCQQGNAAFFFKAIINHKSTER